ncbi:uncharacterized protein EI90DRAFT_1596093 [Cantharellus anzutake]|uniref:uncharacterized protein n=1 Tax=Cantharellus anzutake TaxID=1750568 RepID=UPI001904745B|nr:uncharacterized protein EI90DRAFT_1596093 [Cantharellus anzutake]KAF8328077.1 hypothetical protein EI90DRAFT_1596093 [Cantharellus anzutake]
MSQKESWAFLYIVLTVWRWRATEADKGKTINLVSRGVEPPLLCVSVHACQGQLSAHSHAAHAVTRLSRTLKAIAQAVVVQN